MPAGADGYGSIGLHRLTLEMCGWDRPFLMTVLSNLALGDATVAPGTEDKLTRIFAFLKSNHSWNSNFQLEQYRLHLSPCQSAADRLKSLMHSTVNTQSKPRLETLAAFWQAAEKQPWTKSQRTISGLTEFFSPEIALQSDAAPMSRLFRAIENRPGWGKKTAALFVKNIVNVHRATHKKLHFLTDGDSLSELAKDDRIYLPVDAVIIHLFTKLSGGAFTNFGSINRCLHTLKYSPEDMLLWDDLWYWGFFTQRSGGAKRTVAWNPARYWCLRSTEKNRVAEMEALCKEFRRLI